MGGGMVVASMYPASRIVIKPINCGYTSILDTMLLLRKLRYDFCKCSLILEHRYVYTQRIFNSTYYYCREVFLLLPTAYNLVKLRILFHQHRIILQCLYFIVIRINTCKVSPYLIMYVYPLYSKAHIYPHNEIQTALALG